jgi:membrane peptidoglycan carboxypeptidase
MTFRRPSTRQAIVGSGLIFLGTAVLALLSYVTAPVWTFLVVGNPVLASPDGGVTVIVDVNGDEIARVATAVDFTTLQGEVPVTLKRVVLGTEDRRFYQHNGVDPKGLLRAIVSNVRGQSVQGGSTITQQLVRNETGIGTARTPSRKIREMLNAWRIEGSHDKEWILRRYLDTIWLGDGIRGVESAAFAWYRKGAGDLSLGEAAMISAALPCPEACNPLSHPVTAESRRQAVLDRLSAAGLATAAEIDAARAPSPVFDAPERVTTGDRWVLDTVRRELIAKGFKGFEDGRWPGGLTIRTTIDNTAQQAAVDAVAKTLGDPNIRDIDVEAAAVMIDPGSGGIRAVVGGRDFNVRQVNAALGERGAGSGRQGGSTAKIFALIAALEAGKTEDSYVDAPFEVQVGTKPVRNYDGRSWGRITLRTATRWSVNTAFVNLTRELGPSTVGDVASRFGLVWPSLLDERAVIGVHDTDPVQMAAVMATLANEGISVEAHIVDEIARDSRTVYEANPVTKKVVEPEIAAKAIAVLRGVVTYGTGGRASVWTKDSTGASVSVAVAGKTGTTNNSADAWFVGTTPRLAGAVWIGNPAGSIPLGDVAGYGPPSGGGVPAVIFSKMLTGALEGTAIGTFPGTSKPVGAQDGSTLPALSSRPTTDSPSVVSSPEASPTPSSVASTGMPVSPGELPSPEATPTGTSAAQQPVGVDSSPGATAASD